MSPRLVAALAAAVLAGSASAASGDFLLQIGSPGTGAGQLEAPWGVAVAPDGSVYVTDTANDRVQVFSRSGELLRAWGSHGAATGQLDGPTGIAVCGSTVYVADTNNGRIQLFDTAGGFLAAYGASAPHGLACDDLYLYVAETGANRVAAWAWDDYGTGDPPLPGPGELSAPTGVALGPNGSIFIADTGNDRVVAVGAGTFGTSGSGPGQLLAPAALAVDAGGNVYVSDTGNGRIQVFTAAGVFLSTFAGPGTDPGQLASPSGVALDPAAVRLLVADTGNDRLQAFGAMTSDLAVAGLAVPAVVELYQPFTIDVTVRNLGPGATRSFSVGVRLTETGSSLCSATVAGLAPGADHVQRLTCSIPSATKPGAYSVTARVTRSGGLVDPEASNDAATAAVQVNGPDLVVSAVSAPASAATLHPAQVTFTVANRGAGSAPASKVRLVFVSSTTTSAAAGLLGTVDVGALAAGAQQESTVTLVVPAMLPGTYLVRAVADGTSAVTEVDEANNAGHSQAVAVAGPDLALAGYSLPAFARQGETVALSLTIANQGAGDASRGFQVYVVLTRDGDVCTPVRWCDESDDDWWLGSVSVGEALVSGGQVTVSVPLTLPADFVPLSWNVFAMLDSGAAVAESNEANNEVQLGSTVIGAAATTRIVGIDIKPGSFPNSINLGSGGNVPVAILGSADFDATTVDPLSVTLESSPIVLRGNGTASASVEDVNGDGIADLVVHVATSTLQLTSSATDAVLQGRTYAGQAIAGTDTVNVVP